MGKSLKKEKLEELRDFNMNIQEESWYWRKITDEMEKDISKC
jgi:hypothetical protein